MNRKQRRANGIKDDVKTYTLTDAQITEIKILAAKEAVETSFTAMLGLPLIALRDEFGFGKQRLERFMDKLLSEFECFDEGLVKLEDLKRVIKEETGLDILQ